jgi:hypothetical protein
MRLVRDPKSAASLVDGVRQRLCCARPCGPLYYPHHTLRSCDGACAGATSERPSSPSLGATARSTPSRRAARWRGCVSTLSPSTVRCFLGSCHSRSRRYLSDAGRARVQVVDGVRARLPQATKPGAFVLRLAPRVPVRRRCRRSGLPRPRRARPGTVPWNATRSRSWPAGAASTLPDSRTTQSPLSPPSETMLA